MGVELRGVGYAVGGALVGGVEFDHVAEFTARRWRPEQRVHYEVSAHGGEHPDGYFTNQIFARAQEFGRAFE